MQKFQLACALAVAIFVTGAMLEAKGKPSTVPVGPPATPVAAPATPPVNPPDSLIDFVCSMLPVPYLCDWFVTVGPDACLAAHPVSYFAPALPKPAKLDHEISCTECGTSNVWSLVIDFDALVVVIGFDWVDRRLGRSTGGAEPIEMRRFPICEVMAGTVQTNSTPAPRFRADGWQTEGATGEGWLLSRESEWVAGRIRTDSSKSWSGQDPARAGLRRDLYKTTIAAAIT